MEYDIYRDIAERTDGDVYIGVIGPVRTGKSSFIKRFMEKLVIPNIKDKNGVLRATDELPQAGDGKTVMTTQPSFVPAQAVSVEFSEDVRADIRLVDCVGFPVEGALGWTENGKERMVRTPWADGDMPFSEAASLGTEKVIKEHSTVGILVTTDGSVSELDRSAYITAEERAVSELKSAKKPFIIVLNTKTPSSKQTGNLASSLGEKYGVPVVIADVVNMETEEISAMLEKVLFEFPIKTVNVDMPKWMQILPQDNELIGEIIGSLTACEDSPKMNDAQKFKEAFSGSAKIKSAEIEAELGKGVVNVKIEPDPSEFYVTLSKECGTEVQDDYKLLAYVRRLKTAEKAYSRLKDALEEVEENGYGIVSPSTEDMCLADPEIVKQGGRFGVRLKATAPSLHVMKVDVETEVCPIVGTEQQGEEMVQYLMSEFENDPKNLWETNVFGKSLNDLVKEGLKNKLTSVPTDARNKLRKTLYRIVNEGKGGVVCILL